ISRTTGWLAVAMVAVVVALALLSAATPFVMPSEDAAAHKLAAAGIFMASYMALAIGKIPGLSIDCAGVALVGACLMVASGILPLEDAYKAIDIDTITLLLGMMIIVANLRLSGFFVIVTDWVGRHAHQPLALLAAVTVVAGVTSSFLVNDATCLILAPLVLDLTLALKRNPLPYLLAVAMASNVGSVATITGNPQNIMIGSLSRIPYAEFSAALAPVSVAGLAMTIAFIVLLHRREFQSAELIKTHRARIRVNRVLMVRALGATVITIALFFAGQPPAKGAIVMGGLLLLTRRVRSTRVYAEIDWSLLLMFAGLFIIVAGGQRALLSPGVIAAVAGWHLDQVPVLSAVTAVLSNLVSNVPAVLVIRPFVDALADHRTAWLVVAMASTLAGNFMVLGSVANLIVLEKAASRGCQITAWDYFRVGAPLTLATLIVGTLWLWR
ncbi:MAG TPA: anion transporter, partial [Ktedonobacterales bacterium]|nr:anion transporter [Ktedonobacterales bacterium]